MRCTAHCTLQLLWKLEERGLGLMELQDMSPSDIGSAVRHPAAGKAARLQDQGCLPSGSRGQLVYGWASPCRQGPEPSV